LPYTFEKYAKAMRRILIIPSLLLIGLKAVATGPSERESIYLDQRMELVSNKNQASYYCKLEEKTEKGFLYHAYFITGELKMTGLYLDEDMKTPNGVFTFYHRNGQIESTGSYRNGKKYGLWQRFHEDGSEKAEKIYAIDPVLNALSD